MKVTPTQYANTLYKLTEGKEKSQVDSIAKKFTALLIKNGQLKMAGKIIEKFSGIYNQKNGIVEAEVTTRDKIQDTITKQIEKYIKEKYKAKEVVINNKIDENIKGGIVIKVGDEIIDTSIKNHLINLNKLLKV